MYGKYFTYDGRSSQDYGLMIGSLNNSDDIPFAMSREVYQGTLNRYKNKVNHMGTKWSEVLQFTISMVKDTCRYPDIAVFTEDEVNEINAWLTSPDYPLLFHMYDEKNKIPLNEFASYVQIVYDMLYEIYGDNMPQDFISRAMETIVIDSGSGPDEHGVIVDEVTLTQIKQTWTQQEADDLYDLYVDEFDEAYRDHLYTNLKYDYFGVFSNVEPQLLDGDVVGFTMTFTTNSPFAWSPEMEVSADATENESATIEITVNNSERYREIFPMIEITGVNDGSASAREEITITNNSDNSYVMDGYHIVKTPRSLKLEVPHTEVYIDSEKAKIYDLVTVASENIEHLLNFEDLGIQDISYIYWPRLFNGTNEWVVEGNCHIVIKWREPRKVGAY